MVLKPEKSNKNSNKKKIIAAYCYIKVQLNFNGSNTFGTIEISSRQG